MTLRCCAASSRSGVGNGRCVERWMPYPVWFRRLKACFLVSPLAVSQYLPLELDFDIVVFDEASQVFPRGRYSGHTQG